jgi:hypothetical protein
MNPAKLQTPEEMLERWASIECQCDPSIGYLCECCHDTQVMRDLIKERDRLLEGVRSWSYCTSQGMRGECPEKVEQLADWLLSCKIAPYYLRAR